MVGPLFICPDLVGKRDEKHYNYVKMQKILVFFKK